MNEEIKQNPDLNREIEGKLSKIEDLLSFVKDSIQNNLGLSLSTITDIEDIAGLIIEATKYTITTKNKLLADRIKLLNVSVLYMVTPNLVTRQNDAQPGDPNFSVYIGFNTFPPDVINNAIDKVKKAFVSSLSEINNLNFSDNNEIETSVEPFDEIIFKPDTYSKIEAIYDLCIDDDHIAFSPISVDKNTFLFCIRKADFYLIYKLKLTKKAKLKYLIYILSSFMGDQWYALSAQSIGHTKAECSGANIPDKWEKELRKIIE
ncbi:hypothetical protein [Dysgonomonas sp. 520]|uniref:hypothetical protein n=1 Tax=Dysgonomonas sp. 520 TaxID=2302931 RepID=UPI0013D5595D|nr:hypothetical protein [Dysgonomonas sp. 520]NDW09409.1 hypothetical protein [Dysgonomonas sp. 520]